ncbi:hypothetical protein [Deinococcus sp.]|uniref:hypothetical protein n=1 Tax=Deinococcus sp. TaxID=47478 RepID=UPI0025FC3B2B|nr:hypothetical protein [Deinococcus sp.]
MKRSTSAFALALMLISPLSLAQTNLKLSVNGESSSVSAIVVGGQTYVPLGALTAAGASATTTSSSLSLTLRTLPGGKVAAAPVISGRGGANQLAALEGCVGETLFNGVWRFKVSSLSAATVEGKPGYLVTLEMRNGTPRPQYVYATGLSTTSGAYTLAAADGNTGIWRTNYTLNDFADRTMPQAGLFTYTFKFWPDDDSTPEQAAQAPAKFIMRINTQYVSKTDQPYSVPDPSFRVNLTCKK